MIQVEKGTKKVVVSKNGDCCFKLSFTDSKKKTSHELYYGSLRDLYMAMDRVKVTKVIKKAMQDVLKSRTADMSKYSVVNTKEGWVIGKFTPKGAVNPKNFPMNDEDKCRIMQNYEDLEKLDSEDTIIKL